MVDALMVALLVFFSLCGIASLAVNIWAATGALRDERRDRPTGTPTAAEQRRRRYATEERMKGEMFNPLWNDGRAED